MCAAQFSKSLPKAKARRFLGGLFVFLCTKRLMLPIVGKA
jgi:hypothetical protein